MALIAFTPQELVQQQTRLDEAKQHLAKARELLTEVFNEIHKRNYEVVDLGHPVQELAKQLYSYETNTLFELAGVYVENLECIIEDCSGRV